MVPPRCGPGRAGGQVNLGAMYDDGTGVPQDHTEAARWHRLAADQGGRFGTVQARGGCTTLALGSRRLTLWLPGSSSSPATMATGRPGTSSTSCSPRSSHRHPGPDRGPRCRRPSQRQARDRRHSGQATRRRPDRGADRRPDQERAALLGQRGTPFAPRSKRTACHLSRPLPSSLLRAHDPVNGRPHS